MTEVASRIRVWDLPIRLFHAALAVLVVFSFVTGKIGGGSMQWHVKSGYAILALVLFRLGWGFMGSRTSRFASFLAGPAAALRHARDTLARRAPVVAGHNALGGWMVLLMIAILALQASTGLFADDEIATQGPLAAKVSEALVARMTTLHKYNAWVVASAVALHVAAVAAYQWVFKVNLIGPMVHGWKELPPGSRLVEPPRAPGLLALALLAAAAAAVSWLVMVFPK